MSEWYNDSLEKHIKSNMFSSTSSLAQLARQILSALSFLNENGITHRALASDNVLLTPEVSVMCVVIYILDLGLIFTCRHCGKCEIVC